MSCWEKMNQRMQQLRNLSESFSYVDSLTHGALEVVLRPLDCRFQTFFTSVDQDHQLPEFLKCHAYCRQAAVWGLVKALARPALHALTLGFQHPASGQQMDFQAEAPPDFLRCLEGLRALDT